MSRRLRGALLIGAALVLALLLWLSLRGARHASLARAPAPLPSAPSPSAGVERPDPGRRPSPRAVPLAIDGRPVPPGADELMPHAEAVPPKDPHGPARDWRDFTDDERAAVSGMELDFADIGDVIQRLESGEEIARLRGAPVTAEEQAAIRAEIDRFAATYEDAHDRAYANETTVIELADAVRAARARLDASVRSIYGLTDEQFYELFPYRRELQ
jgi:hypothetical protein